MLLKVGDKVYCKIEYIHTDSYKYNDKIVMFSRNVYYEVLKIDDNIITFESDNGQYMLNMLVVNKIFYSIKEMRLMKLDNLGIV